MKPNFTLEGMTTKDNVMGLIERRLKRMYNLGNDQEERLGQYEKLLETSLKEIDEKIEQYFLDNR